MLDIFSQSVKSKINKNLRKILSISLFPRTIKEKECFVEECNRKCDICKNFLALSFDFTCFATKWKYKNQWILKCDSRNNVYLISYKSCGKQYLGSTTGFEERFRIHKGDRNTDEARCGVWNDLFNVFHSSASNFDYLQVQLIEKVSVQNDDDIDKVLWEREKYWQAQLFTLSYRLNNPNEWYVVNKRGYRK